MKSFLLAVLTLCAVALTACALVLTYQPVYGGGISINNDTSDFPSSLDVTTYDGG